MTAPVFDLIPINELNLDLENPRIQRLIEIYAEEPNEEAMQLALGFGDSSSEASENGPTFKSLQESIRHHGGLNQPIIVNKDENNKLTVIEGNTRLAIYKDFLKKKTPGNWEKIPALVHTNLDSRGKDQIRLQAHIVGPREWDPYSKGKYLNKLKNKLNYDLEEIIEFCGGRKKDIIDYINAYNDMETFYRPIAKRFDPTRFSGFVQLQASGVKEKLKQHGFDETDFSEWIDTRKIDNLREVRDIKKVFDDPNAKKEFLENGMKEAVTTLNIDLIRKYKDSTFNELLLAIIQKHNDMKQSEAEKIISNKDAEVLINIEYLHGLLDKFLKRAQESD